MSISHDSIAFYPHSFFTYSIFPLTRSIGYGHKKFLAQRYEAYDLVKEKCHEEWKKNVYVSRANQENILIVEDQKAQ